MRGVSTQSPAILKNADGANSVGFSAGVTVGDKVRALATHKGFLDLAEFGLPAESMEANAAILNTACNYAYENNIGVIKCDVDATIDPAAYIPNKSNVKFVGRGSLNGLYRVRVHKTESVSYPRFSNINEGQLSAFHKSQTPVVVMMGDSISTGGVGAQGPNAIAFGESMWSCIIKKIRKENPEKEIEFFNRGIGGQTWLNANTLPTAFPSWYLNHATPWLSYVEQLKPDLLLLAFGMNDSNGFNAGALVAVLNKIKAWSKVPAIVFITNPVPALSAQFPDGNGFGFVGQVFQDGRDQVAGFTRGYADFYNHGYIDIHRMFCMVRDGFDPCSGALSRNATDVVPVNGAYTSSTGSIDFSITGRIEGNALQIADIFNAVNGAVACRCGLNGADLIFLISDGLGNIRVQLNAAGLNVYGVYDTGVPFPVSDFTVTIDVRNTALNILLNENLIFTKNIVRQAALFPVQFGYQGFASGPFSLITFNSGKGQTVGKSAFDYEIWGVSTATAETKLPLGGNGVNHYAAGGISKIVEPALDAVSFAGRSYVQRYVNPYPLTKNEHFIDWSGAEIDEWTRLTAVFPVKNVGDGIHGAPNGVGFGVYPCGIKQNIVSKLSRENANYKLIVIAKNGTVIGNNSVGYVSPHGSRVVISYNDGTPKTKTILLPEKNIGIDWGVGEWDLGRFAGGVLPPKSQVTGFDVSVYLSDNTVLGFIGVYESDADANNYFSPI